MSKDWESFLDRWTAADLLTGDAAQRIREWENQRSRTQGLGWPIRIALAIGAILLAAGVLLFVSAHWDELSPAGRMSLVVTTVAVLHAAGAIAARRFEALAIALHTVGSIAMGGAIALAGQIYNLNEHWPAAVLLWAIGCALAWWLLGHWTQGALCAILFPWWLAGEWEDRFASGGYMLPAWMGICALCWVYLAARGSESDGPLRKSLAWIGGLAILPATAVVAFQGYEVSRQPHEPGYLGWIIGLLLPLAVALLLNRTQILYNGIAVVWVMLLAVVGGAHAAILVYAWCLIGTVGLALWGVREGRPERINLGLAGFGITLLVFYFSDVMDKLGRSFSLIGLGLVTLGCGWVLERIRQRLLARVSREVL